MVTISYKTTPKLHLAIEKETAIDIYQPFRDETLYSLQLRKEELGVNQYFVWSSACLSCYEAQRL